MTGEARATPAPQDVLGYLLKHAHGRFTTQADAALAPFGIDSKDFGALRILAHREPTSQLEVARALGVDRTSMVALLDVLERKGIVARRPDPADRRRNVVELTEEGAVAFAGAERAYAETEAAFLSVLGASATEQFYRALRSLLADPAQG
ncbi:MarR family transcriptional regulator [Microbacteriaceae bacterium VKM Ac-2854]|nr:MarR family transcriptional regulator [Microbacteriaceae bacterium VKM Ac-2854]